MQRLGSLSNGSQAGLGFSCERWLEIVAMGTWQLYLVRFFIKRMMGPWANALKVKPGQSCSTHKFSMSWLNNSWSVGYIHATKQVLYWLLFLLQVRLGKHHITKTSLWCWVSKCSVNAEVDDFQTKIFYTLIRSGLASFCILLLGNIFRLSAIN